VPLQLKSAVAYCITTARVRRQLASSFQSLPAEQLGGEVGRATA
jgi:hypothetical protein